MPRSGDTRWKILEVAEAEFASEEGYAGAHLLRVFVDHGPSEMESARGNEAKW